MSMPAGVAGYHSETIRPATARTIRITPRLASLLH